MIGTLFGILTLALEPTGARSWFQLTADSNAAVIRASAEGDRGTAS